ncbi:DUF1361 domain-containing protein [Psychromicrobium sp. YIM B11713]|uniref:DUF1361 domain-containing protein n=1 Tax=Psychromicrobium sp. YIM B11713 TaxID=3145233 RepID=UPI00374E46B3
MGFSALIFSTIGLNVYALILVLIRAVLYKQPVYRPMLWNIWLSVLPVFVLIFSALAAIITVALTHDLGTTGKVVSAIVIICGVLAWLLLLPNSAYLITELNLNHRVENDTTPLWYDIVSVLTLAMSGVVNMIANLFLVTLLFVALVFNDFSGLYTPLTAVFVGALIVLVSFGVYLGRYLRFNSWDIKHPLGMLRKAIAHFRQPGTAGNTVVFVLTHSVFFGLMYGCIAMPVLQLLDYSHSLLSQLR